MRERSRLSTTRSAEVDRKTRLAVRGISSNLRRLLKDVSPDDLAKTLHLPVDRVRGLLEGDVSDIGINELTSIARAYDVRLSELFEGLDGV